MNSNRRLIQQSTQANSTLNSNSVDNITLTLDESDRVNVHGLRCCGSIEPENADANANGFWLALCLPGGVIASADLPSSYTDLDDEDFNAYVWGIGCWTASNQAPYHFEFAPSTSRNCQKGARIRFYICKSGISAGAVRINMLLSCFTTS